ncbi:MAG TPA: LysR family transcriptional regulator [Patescibacteria group bacterium]|nr:LysR family transcriptional regulator [Patescibacteria group bacterium]
MEDRLKKFAALVDAGSFTKAAAELHVSQPALTAAVQKLERELKTSLLVHGVRPLRMTLAGDLAYASAKELIVHAQNLQVRLAALSHAEVRLRIGMIDSIAAAVCATTELTAPGHNVKLSITVNNSRNLLQDALRDEVDLVFITGQPAAPQPLLEVQHLADEPLVVVCHSSQAARVQKDIKNGSIEHFVSYDQPSATSRLVQEALRTYGVTPRISVYSSSPEVMLRLVLSQQGVAALPYATVAPLLESGELAIVGLPAPWIIVRAIALAKRRDKDLAPSLTRLVRQVRRSLDADMAAAASRVNTMRT